MSGNLRSPLFRSRPATLLALLLAGILAGCASKPPASPEDGTHAATEAISRPTSAGGIATASGTAVARNLKTAHWGDLPGWGQDDLGAAWPAFLQSCKALSKGNPVWKRLCEQAKNLRGTDTAAIRQFFETQFRPFALVSNEGSSSGLITGYYEPLLRGSRLYGGAYVYPLLGVPDDLIPIDLGEVFPELKGARVRGRMAGKKIVPYYTRAEIEARQKKLDIPPLVWVDDAVELFFMQVQGSGRVGLPDGTQMRFAYGDQNGHPYRSIGKVLIDRGELKAEEASMQGIQNWVRNHPERLAELLNSNPSYVFFKEMPASNDGPPGALGVPLTAERSIAIDPRFVPLGVPVFLETTLPNTDQPLRRLVLAQDTGGAIKGAPRADFFWGFGPKAGEQAGRMKQNGRMWILLPLELAPK